MTDTTIGSLVKDKDHAIAFIREYTVGGEYKVIFRLTLFTPSVESEDRDFNSEDELLAAFKEIVESWL